MKAEITFHQLYWNTALMNFFFREQSSDAIEELFERAKRDGRELEEIIEDYVDSNDCCYKGSEYMLDGKR